MCQQMRRIRVLCYHGHGLIGTAIRWQTRSEYSHVAFLLGAMVIESDAPQGVLERPYDERDSSADVYYLDVTQQDYDRLYRWLQGKLGLRYDWLAILRFVSRRNHRGGQHRYFCSELVAEGFELLGQPLQRAEPWKISPALVAMSVVLTPEQRPPRR